jgi:methenyltetrahydromethanopterin cyclohydrolase
MWGWLNNETRQTIDFDFVNLLQFGRNLALSISDWYQMMDKIKIERIKKAVQLQASKK